VDLHRASEINFIRGYEDRYRCQAKFLTSNHVRMQKVIFYTPNTLIKLIIRG